MGKNKRYPITKQDAADQAAKLVENPAFLRDVGIKVACDYCQASAPIVFDGRCASCLADRVRHLECLIASYVDGKLVSFPFATVSACRQTARRVGESSEITKTKIDRYPLAPGEPFLAPFGGAPYPGAQSDERGRA